MALSFPTGPSSGTQYTSGNNTWTWNGTTWDVLRIPTGAPGSTGALQFHKNKHK